MYSDIVNKLVKESRQNEDGSWYYSAYINKEDSNPKLFRKRILHQLSNSLTEADLESQQMHEAITNALSQNKLDFGHAESAAIFSKYTAQEEIPVTVSIYPMYSRVHEKSFIGKTYDLLQLMHHESLDRNVLVINLDQESASVYSYIANELKLMMQIDNKYDYRRIDEYLDKYSPTKKDQAYYGTGSDKTARDKEKANRMFVKEAISELLDKKLTTQRLKKYHCVMLLFSSNFTEFIALVKSDLEKRTNTSVTLISKNLDSDQEIAELVRKKLFSNNSEKVKKLYLKADKAGLIVKGWGAVIRASRNRKIKELFASPLQKRPGYVRGSRVYNWPIEGSKRVSHIMPWISTSLAASSAAVFVSEEVPAEIAASLRY